MMPSAGCGKPAGLMSGRASIDVAGKMREYILAVPSNYDQNRPYRLIFGWHPWGGSAQQIATSKGYFGLSSAINGQAILVAPEGQDYQDNGLGWGNANGEDIAFAHAMMDRFSAQLCIDQNRIFSTGFSFGAMFSFTLACTAGQHDASHCAHGRQRDDQRPLRKRHAVGGDAGLHRCRRHPARRSPVSGSNLRRAQRMFDANDAGAPSWCDGLASNYLPCSCVQYQGCKAGYPVIECEYKAGHQFAPSAGATLWNFFSQF